MDRGLLLPGFSFKSFPPTIRSRIMTNSASGLSRSFKLPESFVTIILFCLLHSCLPQRPLDANDVYTFCGSGRARGDIAFCKGYCPDSSTKCSAETGVCSCSTTKTIPNAAVNYNCKPAASRTRCSNACKTYAAIESFRRGDSRICTSNSDSRKMCFCMPRIK